MLPLPTPFPSRARNSSAPTLQPTAPARKSTVDVTLLWDLRGVRKRTGPSNGNGDASALDEETQQLLLATCQAAYRDPRLLVVRPRSG
jgi:hypothetical protein